MRNTQKPCAQSVSISKDGVSGQQLIDYSILSLILVGGHGFTRRRLTHATGRRTVRRRRCEFDVRSDQPRPLRFLAARFGRDRDIRPHIAIGRLRRRSADAQLPNLVEEVSKHVRRRFVAGVALEDLQRENFHVVSRQLALFRQSGEDSL